MNYIIDPMWFYWIDVIGGISGFCVAMVILLVCGGIALAIIYSINYAMVADFPNSSESEKRMCASIERMVKPLCIMFAICALIIILVPGESTIYKMLLAHVATYENAEIAIDSIQSAADYIINAMKEVG